MQRNLFSLRRSILTIHMKVSQIAVSFLELNSVDITATPRRGIHKHNFVFIRNECISEFFVFVKQNCKINTQLKVSLSSVLINEFVYDIISIMRRKFNPKRSIFRSCHYLKIRIIITIWYDEYLRGQVCNSILIQYSTLETNETITAFELNILLQALIAHYSKAHPS